MTTTIQNLSDLQDRRIMMDKKLPPYGYAFVILTGLFMIFLVIWSTQTNRIYVSQNSGVVQAANKTYIMSSYSGSITELYVSEGSYVNEGDLIARLKSTDLDMQKDTLQSQLDIYQKQLDQYNKLLKCIQDDTNYFDETSAEDQPYYYQYQTYKSQVAQKTFDASTYQAAGYSDTQIKALMEQNQSELESLYYSTMQSISQSINSAQVNVDNLQAQMDSLNTGANDYFIYAPTSGDPHGHPLQGGHGAERRLCNGYYCQRERRSGDRGHGVGERPSPAARRRPLQDRHHRPVGVFLRHADRHRHLH